MTENYESIPTILAYSEQELGVIAGGGIMGYGGVVVHEPMQEDFSKFSRDLYDEVVPKGIGFGYHEVSTISVSGLLVWTNAFLERAPKGRQDVKETGIVRVELFDRDETRQRLVDCEDVLGKLGIKLLEYK